MGMNHCLKLLDGYLILGRFYSHRNILLIPKRYSVSNRSITMKKTCYLRRRTEFFTLVKKLAKILKLAYIMIVSVCC